MATTVTYKGQVLVTVDNSTKVLETSGTWCEDDFTLVDTGGGGSALLELLEEITLSENTRDWQVDFSQYIAEGYNTIYGYVDLTLSGNDYIYYGVMKSAGNILINSWVTQRTTEREWRFIWGNMPGGSNFCAAATGAVIDTDIVKFCVRSYNASVYITTGSVFRLYGIKYSI